MRGLLQFSKSDAATFRHCAQATGAEIHKSKGVPSGYIGIHEPIMYPGSLSTGIYIDGFTATRMLEDAYPDAINEDGTILDGLKEYWEAFKEKDSAFLDIHVMKLSLGWFRSCYMASVTIHAGSKGEIGVNNEPSGSVSLGIAAARNQNNMWDQIQDALRISNDSYALPYDDTQVATNALLGR